MSGADSCPPRIRLSKSVPPGPQNVTSLRENRPDNRAVVKSLGRAPIRYDWCSRKNGDCGGRHALGEGGRHVEVKGETQVVLLQVKQSAGSRRGEGTCSPSARRRNQPCRPLRLGLLASRIVRRQPPGVKPLGSGRSVKAAPARAHVGLGRRLVQPARPAVWPPVFPARLSLASFPSEGGEPK